MPVSRRCHGECHTCVECCSNDFSHQTLHLSPRSDPPGRLLDFGHQLTGSGLGFIFGWELTQKQMWFHGYGIPNIYIYIQLYTVFSIATDMYFVHIHRTVWSFLHWFLIMLSLNIMEPLCLKYVNGKRARMIVQYLDLWMFNTNLMILV